MATVYEIVQGLAQAAANAYDGALGEDYEPAKDGILRREEGNALIDQRVMDGFNVKFYGNKICIKYQGDIKLKEIHSGGFEGEMERRLNEIKKFLQKEYKAITVKGITLTKVDDIHILATSVSRVRSFVQAYRHYNISGIKEDEGWKGSEGREVDSAVRKFLELNNNNKRPQNDTRKKGANQK